MTTFKVKAYALLEGAPRGTRGQRIFDVILISLILGNVLVVFLSTVQSLGAQYGRQFFIFELVSVAVFTLELILRFWVSDLSQDTTVNLARWRFWINPFILADLLAVLGFSFGVLFNVDLRLFWLLRLVRVFKISCYMGSLSLLWSVIKQEFRPMLSALAIISILVLFATVGIYLLEREGQPESFGNLPSCLWWTVVTVSTVGYGDAVPVTWLGRILGTVIMLLGIGMVALPAGMLASRFSEVMHRKQELFRRFVEDSIEATGGIAEELLEQRRLELFIGRTEAKSIIANCIDESQRQLNFCPSCGSKLPGRKPA